MSYSSCIYQKKVKTLMVNNSTNVNKTYNLQTISELKIRAIPLVECVRVIDNFAHGVLVELWGTSVAQTV